jgi:tetratricopeptide (TPR) repeat protein
LEDWTDRVYYGGDLPRVAEKALHMAAAHWHDPAAAEAYLAQAYQSAPDHRAVKLGHYKYFFYRKDLPQAAPYALLCVEDSARALNLPADWRLVRPSDAAFDTPLDEIEAEPRFFLYALKAYGYVLFRQGAVAEGITALRKVIELDPKDRTATKLLLAVIERGPPDDQDDD